MQTHTPLHYCSRSLEDGFSPVPPFSSVHKGTLGPHDIYMGLADLTQDKPVPGPRTNLSPSREASRGKAAYPGCLREHNLPAFGQLNLHFDIVKAESTHLFWILTIQILGKPKLFRDACFFFCIHSYLFCFNYSFPLQFNSSKQCSTSEDGSSNEVVFLSCLSFLDSNTSLGFLLETPSSGRVTQFISQVGLLQWDLWLWPGTPCSLCGVGGGQPCRSTMAG